MKIRHLTVFTILALVSSISIAGYIQPATVTIDEAAMYATGDQWTARTADNDVELIGCGVRWFDDGLGNSYAYGFCQATDANEVKIICTTQNEILLDVIKALSTFSFITFSWNADNECTRIGMSTQSFYLPLFKTDDDSKSEDDDSSDDD